MRGNGKAAGRPIANDDRGMTAVEFVVLTPIMFLLLMLTVQFAIYMFARQAAQGAVNAGGRVAREEAGVQSTTPCTDAGAPWRQHAIDATTTRAASLGGSLLDAKTQTVTTTTTAAAAGSTAVGSVCNLAAVSVTYSANVPMIVPGMRLTVTVVSSGPIEQLVGH